MYILCSYVPRSHLCLTADLVAWYCIVRVYTHRLSWLGVSLGLSLRIPPSSWVGPIIYLGLCSFIYFGFPFLAWVISSVLGCPYSNHNITTLTQCTFWAAFYLNTVSFLLDGFFLHHKPHTSNYSHSHHFFLVLDTGFLWLSSLSVVC